MIESCIRIIVLVLSEVGAQTDIDNSREDKFAAHWLHISRLSLTIGDGGYGRDLGKCRTVSGIIAQAVTPTLDLR